MILTPSNASFGRKIPSNWSLRTTTSSPSSSRLAQAVPPNVHELLRSTSQAASRRQRAAEFRCVVCLENCPIVERVVLANCLAAPHHAMCGGCAGVYFAGRIEEGRIGDLRCPLYGEEGCAATATEGELRGLVGADSLTKFQRFAKMAQDSTLRECPTCLELVRPNLLASDATPAAAAGDAARRSSEGGGADGGGGVGQDGGSRRWDPEASGAASSSNVGSGQDGAIAKAPEAPEAPGAARPAVDPEMVCSSGHTFCFYHASAHPVGPGECEAYACAQTREARAALAASGAKECPGCGIATEKNSGCNHMTCFTCKQEWCWTCGRSFGGQARVGWHYNPANPMGCMQFVDVELAELRSVRTLMARVLALPGTLLGILSFWGTLPLWITCCFGVLVTVLVFISVSIAWLIVACLLLCLTQPCCWFQEEQITIICTAPWASCWASFECLFGPFEEEAGGE